MKDDFTRLIARWESKTAKYYLELNKDENGYYYTACDGGGNLGKLNSDSDAINLLQQRVALGEWLPDDNKIPMKRIY